MSSEDWAFVSALLTAFAGIVGAWATWVDKSRPQGDRWMIVICIAVLSIGGAIATFRQNVVASKDTAKANLEQKEAVSRLQKATNTLQDAQAANNELQKTIAKLGMENGRLTQHVYDQMTGAESFAYIMVTPQSSATFNPTAIGIGRNALQNISVRYFYTDIPSPESQPIALQVFTIPFVNATTGTSNYSTTFRLQKPDAFDMNFFFFTAFSKWMQELHMRRIGGTWVSATRLKLDDGKGTLIVQCRMAAFPIQHLADSAAWKKQIGCEGDGVPSLKAKR